MSNFKEYFEKYINMPSPIGFTIKAIEEIKSDFEKMGLETFITKKGALIGTLKGEDDSRAIALSTHIDTLGAMVKAIRNDGRLKMAKLGGGSFNAIEGENCTIFTRDGKTFRGSIVPDMASAHIYGAASSEEKRTEDNMAVRLDECVNSQGDVLQLGIQVGDIIAMDPRPEFTDSGFIKSRYLDNKAAVAIALTLIDKINSNNIVPKNTLHFVISNYEECGHGVSYLPENTHVLLSLDIAPVGKDQSSSEFKTTIAAKDNKTPYDYNLITELANIAKNNNIDYVIDVFNFYSSDSSQYIQNSRDLVFGLVGFGTDSTHHYERTHIKSIEETTKLLYLYLTN